MGRRHEEGIIVMEKATVIVIGGGATGVGILRDLAMRGVDTLLLEQRDIVHGTSSRYHGLLHSGGRYAVKDTSSAKECIDENIILRRIAKYCVEDVGGLFVRTAGDDRVFEDKWLAGCAAAGIDAEPISLDEAWRIEPHLCRDIQAVYRVPDGSIDGFRLGWQNIDSAKRYGGRIKTYTEVIDIITEQGHVVGVSVRDNITKKEYTIGCDYLVNAAGPWAGKIVELVGLETKIQPDKGVLIAFHTRITNHVVNRLHPPSDGDIFVPTGTVTLLGTTSFKTNDPNDTSISVGEIEKLMALGEPLIQNLRNYRILRAFSGSRPLYVKDDKATGRDVARGFAIIDHRDDGIEGFSTIVGGKLTTYRLMAEKMADHVSEILGNTQPCRTAHEPLIETMGEELTKKVHTLFPAFATAPALGRLGTERVERIVERIALDPTKAQLVCECENVTRAEVEEIASEPTSHSLSDVRRKTRMGMGTCQGAFCSVRGLGVAMELGLYEKGNADHELRSFLEGRWKGMRPVLWGKSMREADFMRNLYGNTLHLNGALEDEKV